MNLSSLLSLFIWNYLYLNTRYTKGIPYHSPISTSFITTKTEHFPKSVPSVLELCYLCLAPRYRMHGILPLHGMMITYSGNFSITFTFYLCFCLCEVVPFQKVSQPKFYMHLLFPVCHMSHSPHPWYNFPSNIRWRVLVVMVFIM